jgi:hypothetical protein
MFSFRGERLAAASSRSDLFRRRQVLQSGMTAANVGKIGAVVDPTPMVQDIETAWRETRLVPLRTVRTGD